MTLCKVIIILIKLGRGKALKGSAQSAKRSSDSDSSPTKHTDTVTPVFRQIRMRTRNRFYKFNQEQL